MRGAQDRLGSQLGTLATQLDQSNDQLRAQVRALREVPTQINELGQSVAELRARTEAPQRAWVRAEALYLLELGARRLQLEHDVPTAIAAMESADARLATVTDPAVNEVRRQLARELAALRAVNVPDVPAVIARLTTLEARAEPLSRAGRADSRARDACKWTRRASSRACSSAPRAAWRRHGATCFPFGASTLRRHGW